MVYLYRYCYAAAALLEAKTGAIDLRMKSRDVDEKNPSAIFRNV